MTIARAARWGPILALVCTATGCGRGERDTRPNVLLISLDTVRRDLSSVYGHRAPHAPDVSSSPLLERLASEGVVFERAYSTTSWTLPAHASLLSGKPELVHGVELDVLSLGAEHATLAEVLRGAGYRTAGFYSGPYLDPRYGLGRGFERYQACYGEALARAVERARALERDPRPQAAIESAQAHAAVESLSHRDSSSAVVSDAVLAELAAARADGRPWMIFAHYFDPHFDFVPPPPFDSRFDPEYGGSQDGRELMTNPSISSLEPTYDDPFLRVRKVSDRDLEHVRALYAGELAWTDLQLARVIDALAESGDLERTIVVVVADHGEEFFDHERLGHRKTVFEEVVRIPLIARFPRELPRGRRVTALASIHDVYATVLELARVPAPPLTVSRSLVPLATGDSDGAERWVLGRLVNTLSLPHSSGSLAVDTWIDEFFVQGPIKVRRTRRWIAPGPRTAPAQRAEFARIGARMRAADRSLEWIDIEAHPGEDLAAYSSDFTDERAARALQRFHDVYAELCAQRADPGNAGRGATDESMLAALGYTGEGAQMPSPDAALSETLRLPPPALE